MESVDTQEARCLTRVHKSLSVCEIFQNGKSREDNAAFRFGARRAARALTALGAIYRAAPIAFVVPAVAMGQGWTKAQGDDIVNTSKRKAGHLVASLAVRALEARADERVTMTA